MYFLIYYGIIRPCGHYLRILSDLDVNNEEQNEKNLHRFNFH